MTKKILVGVPIRLLNQIDLLTDSRSQTRSEFIREALRQHLERLNPGALRDVQPTLSVITGSASHETRVAEYK